MDTQDIVQALKHDESILPPQALEEAIAQRDEIICVLTQIIEGATAIQCSFQACRRVERCHGFWDQTMVLSAQHTLRRKADVLGMRHGLDI